MRLRKVEWYEVPLSLLDNTKKSSDSTSKLTTELASIRKDLDWVKNRKPDYFPGGSGAVGSYHRVTTEEIIFSKHSFNPGVNVIGVATGLPVTIWLPKDLEPNHVIAVKDELGIAAQQPITLRVKI